MIAGANINVLDYGTVSSTTINAALLAAALQGGGVVNVPRGSYTLTDTMIIASNTTLDFNNSTITGPGLGSATDLIQSGYLSGGAIVTNIGTGIQVHSVSGIRIKNAVITNCGKALNLYECLWQCEFSFIFFSNCTYNIYADRCFYATFKNLTSRGAAGGATNAAFYFTTFVNIQMLESISVTERVLGIEIAGGANAIKLFNCSAETCTTGIKISNETGPITFDTCYIEDNTIGVDLNTNFTKYQISFVNCFVHINLLGIKGPVSFSPASTISIDNTNRFFNNTTDVDFSNNSINTQNGISYVCDPITDSTLPAVPIKILLGNGNIPNIDQLWYNSGDASVGARTKVVGGSPIAFHAEGNGGTLTGSGATPFFSAANSGSGASVSCVIDTAIKYDVRSANLVFNLEFIDFLGTYLVYGFIFGTNVVRHDPSGQTLVVSNNAGKVRLTVSNFNTLVNTKGFIRFI